MIVDPILIIGAPRSGTSLLQKIVRENPDIWSLPSEGNEIWDQWCSPDMRGWTSEVVPPDEYTPEAGQQIREQFERQCRNYRVWKFVSDDAIWNMKRKPLTRAILKKAYYGATAILPKRAAVKKRILDKTASNCFRIEYVRQVFPDAKIVYITRDGRDSVQSMMRGWRNPSRFFTYDVPAPLNIDGYSGNKWNFVLPPGWQKYTHKPLEEVCAFQWKSANKHALRALENEVEGESFITTKLEDIVATPADEISRIFSFLDIPEPERAQEIAVDLPVVNSSSVPPDAATEEEEIRERISNVEPQLEGMLETLGYPSTADAPPP